MKFGDGSESASASCASSAVISAGACTACSTACRTTSAAISTDAPGSLTSGPSGCRRTEVNQQGEDHGDEDDAGQDLDGDRAGREGPARRRCAEEEANAARG